MKGLPKSFHVMAKPSGPICNLDCQYCFYLDKTELFPKGTRFRMSDEVLEAYIRQQFESQEGGSVLFAWQGGEPTLMGVGFFEKVVALQKKHGGGRRAENAIQTNGILLDDAWGAFLHREKFLVGLSIDGPSGLHDFHRVDSAGKPTFDRVMRGLQILKRHQVEFNTLTVVHRESAKRPLEVYDFLKDTGSQYLQFIPLVDRLVPGASPSAVESVRDGAASQVTDFSVLPEDYGAFLTSIFDTWVREDVGKVYVQLFDVALGIWMGMPSGLCLFSESCGDAVALEHNGDLYSCDHFVSPAYRLGNLLNQSLGDMVRSAAQRSFGQAKADTLPQYCLRCPVKFACNGECPKNRFITSPDGEPGLNYLCTAYRRFFTHANPYLRGMAWLALNGRSPADIMSLDIPGIAAGETAVTSDDSKLRRPAQGI
jgi:uncharacterized protein